MSTAVRDGGYGGYDSAAVLPDGRVVVASTGRTSPQRVSVTILTPDGRPDPSNGELVIEFPGESPSQTDYGAGLAVGPDGRIVVVGQAYTNYNALLPNPYDQNDLIMAVLVTSADRHPIGRRSQVGRWL